MTKRPNRAMDVVLSITLAALLVLAPGALAAQDSQFDLRTRTSPTSAPEPTVVGPVDPDTLTVRPRPRAEPAIVLPSPQAQPNSTAATGAVAATPTASTPGGERSSPRPTAGMAPANSGDAASAAASSARPLPAPAAVTPAASATQPTAKPEAYTPRDLGLVSRSGGIGLGLGLATLILLLLGGGWMAWSRHFRHRARALRAPLVERPRVAPAADKPQPLATPQPAGSTWRSRRRG